MFFNILGNLEPRPLACAAQGCPVSCPGRGQPWKYLRQRTRPRVTARRCPMRRTPSRRRQFEGRPLAGALSRGRVDGCIRSRRPTLIWRYKAVPRLFANPPRQLAYACWVARLPGLPMTSRDDSLLASSCWTFGRSG